MSPGKSQTGFGMSKFGIGAIDNQPTKDSEKVEQTISKAVSSYYVRKEASTTRLTVGT